MKGQIFRILPLKYSKTDGDYLRIFLRMEDGSVRHTDLVSIYRNFSHWSPYLKVGISLAGLEPLGKNKINADCHPYIPCVKRPFRYEFDITTNTVKMIYEDIILPKSLPAVSLKQQKLINN